MKKREKQKWKRYVIGILTCMLLLGSISPALAANEGGSSNLEDSIETGTVTAIGDTTISVDEYGAVVIEMTAKTAINKWKWRTIGYYLTKNKLSISSANLSGAAGSGVKSSHVLWVDEGHTCKVRGCPYYGKPDGTRDDTSKNGVTTTKITIDKACITAHRNAAGIKLDNGEETTLYLQGVLAFYYGETKRYGDFYSVDQARAKNRALGDGTDWSKFPKSSGEGWVKRYNIPISYMPDKTTVYINYYRKNAKADKENGATTTWTKVDEKNRNEEDYE